MGEQYVEPWLRGTLTGVDPALAPVLYSFQQALEDLGRWTADLTEDQLWAEPLGTGSVGFHIKHIQGSVDRLLTYALGDPLSEQQLVDMKTETAPGGTRNELIEHLEAAFARYAEIVRSIDPASFAAPRYVGRKRLPTTVGGLLTHVAEHTQRHVGEAIITTKLVRGLR